MAEETKTKTQAATKNTSRNRAKPLTPRARYTLLGAAAALALSLALGIWGYFNLVEQARQAQVQSYSERQANSAAEALGYHLQGLNKQVGELSLDPASAAIVASGDAAAIATLEQQLARQLPNAAEVAAFPTGIATAPPADQSSLSFTELNLVSVAEKGERVQPEAVRQGDQWQVKLVSPVRANTDAAVVGTFLISFPLDVLTPALASHDPQMGRLELQQRFQGRQSTTLLARGEGSGAATEPVAVAGAPWQVRFAPSAQALKQLEVNLAPYVGAWLAITLLALLAAVLIARAAAGRTAGSNPTGRSDDDLSDIELNEADEVLLALEQRHGSKPESVVTPPMPADVAPAPELADVDVPEVIFRAYDIRGLAESQITPELAYLIGQALGSEAFDNGQDTLVVARDVRTHSPTLAEHLVQGILATGCHVINIGTVPTPLMYFATETLAQTRSGVMVTASHNGPEYNGFKVVINGKSRSAEDIQNVRTRILAKNFHNGRGQEQHLDIVPEYVDAILADVALAGEVHLVVDAGNGVTGAVAPRLFEELGCRVTPLFCDFDGTFPNHAPDPSVAANLEQLVAKVKEEGADLGVAFDGDGDRLTVVTASGTMVWADRLLMLLAKDIVVRNPGADVVFDIKSTRQLNSAVSGFGGRPIMWKTGHAPMRAKMLETGALVGGEFSGHIFIKDRWYGFDDGLYAAARLIEIMALKDEGLDTMLAEFPPMEITPELLVAVAEDRKFAIVRQLQESGDFGEARLTTLDGLRADFPYGWGLIRASNTSANLTLRFEADTQAQIAEIQALFARELKKIDPSIRFD